MPKQLFPRTYNKTDFGVTADVAVYNGKWTNVGTVTVPAQQFIHFGVGQIANGVDSRETATIRFDDTSGQLHGVIRLVMADANLTNLRVIKEDRTENFDDGVKIAMTALKVKEDSKLIVQFNPDADATIDFDDADTSILMPVTVEQ